MFERFPRLRVAFFECSAEWIDQYQQVVTHIYIMKVEQRGGRLVNAIVDRIPNVTQEDSWKWWKK